MNESAPSKEMKERFPKSDKEPVYLVIACGEGHETRISAESDIVATLEYFYSEEGMDDEEKSSWQKALNDEGKWKHDNRGNRTEWSEEFEMERVHIVRMTGKLPGEEIERLKVLAAELGKERDDWENAYQLKCKDELLTIAKELEKERDEAMKIIRVMLVPLEQVSMCPQLTREEMWGRVHEAIRAVPPHHRD